MNAYPKYKDSGIDWIGKIPEGWTVSRAKYYTEIKSGDAISKEQINNNGMFPVYGGGELIGYTDVYNIDGNTIVIGRVGARCGCITLTSKKSWATDNALIVDTTFDVQYFAKLLDAANLNRLNESNAQPLITATKIKNLSVPVPPLSEQQEIAAYLDKKTAKIDELMAEKTKQVKDLQSYRTSVITESVTRGLNLDAPLRQSGIDWIGEIPEHWKILKIKYVFENLDYLREPIASENRERNNPKYDYYGASGVIDKVDGYNVDDKILLIGEDGANLVMRNLPLVYKASGKVWVNNHAHILKPTSIADYEYMFYMLESIDYSDFITGSAQPKLSQGNLSNVPVIIPPLSEQQEIAAYLDEKTAKIDKLIGELNAQLTELADYKQAVISEAVTGKVDVRNYRI